MNILYASPEVTPFASTGGLADVSRSLPKALKELSSDVTVILPYYKAIKNRNIALTPFQAGEFNFYVHAEGGISYVFVANDQYYDRDNLYGEHHGDYGDNDLRFSYFSRAVVSYAQAADASFDIIHCNDWQTGLVPLYSRTGSLNIKTLFTIHNIAYQGVFPKGSLKRIGIPKEYYKSDGIEYYGKISFLKSGTVYASAVNTVSRKYREEIMTRQLGCGMDGVLRARSSDFHGILNGADYKDWDPRTDKLIKRNYDAGTLEGKRDCKRDLLETTGLGPMTMDRPLIGVISRLVEQKGIDLLVKAAPEIINSGASIVILGTGEERYNNLCRNMAKEHPDYVSCNIRFDNGLAHKIEAGSDIFIMPSRYEPCGLNQLYSMRYGTLPVVSATGGLDDTITDLYEDGENGNGIKFARATKNDMLDGVRRSIELYKDKAKWQRIIKRIMGLDFSWKKSAAKYKELYENIVKR